MCIAFSQKTQQDISNPNDNLTPDLDRSIFRWNDLPGEIKNTIYGYSLSVGGPFEIKARKGRKGRWHNYKAVHSGHSPFNPNLVLLNKKAKNEATPLLYRGKHYQFVDNNAFIAFFHRLRIKYFKYIEHIALPKARTRREESDVRAANRMLARCGPTLKSITFNIGWERLEGRGTQGPVEDLLVFVSHLAKPVIKALGRTWQQRDAPVVRLSDGCISELVRWKLDGDCPDNADVQKTAEEMQYQVCKLLLSVCEPGGRSL